MLLLRWKDEYGTDEDMKVHWGSYQNNPTCGALSLVSAGGTYPGEPYGTVTKNLVDEGYVMPKWCAFIDANNMPEAPAILQKAGLAEPTGGLARSGFCEYPLFMFHKDVLAKYVPKEDLKAYEDAYDDFVLKDLEASGRELPSTPEPDNSEDMNRDESFDF